MARGVYNWFPASQRGTAQGAIWMSARFMGGLTPLIWVCLTDPKLLALHWRAGFWIFTGVGLHFVLRWARPREVVVVKEVRVREGGPFVLNEIALAELGLTQRGHEILGLIAAGLSNREIGEKLFVSENTVKTHSSRLFQKLSVNRRTQAVQKGKDLGLIP